MRIVYLGPRGNDEVIVPDFTDERGYPQTVKRGVPVEVPDELAASLLEQPDNWAEAPAKAGRNTVPTE